MLRDQTIGEEIANSISHGIGTALCIAGLAALMWHAAPTGGARLVTSCAIFGATSVVLYLCSTLYHALSYTRAQRVMRSLDHSSIYLLIAGTYTPFTLVTLQGAMGWTLFGIVWGCALFGVVFKAIAVGKFPILSASLYVAMGWSCIVAIRTLFLLLTHSTFALLVAGGVCYTLGVPFFASKRRYMHFIWHLWVLAGTACHFAAVWMLVK